MIEAVRATFPILDEWHETLAEPYVPQAGSELARDDTDWPPVRLSQVAIMGLGSARDHLHAVRVLIEAGELFPFAQSTLIRAALVGAEQAVWVLTPQDPAERLSRGRCIAVHMYAEQGKYVDLLRGLAPEPHEPTETVAAVIRQRRSELAELRDRSGQRAVLNTTAMVEEAALAASVKKLLPRRFSRSGALPPGRRTVSAGRSWARPERGRWVHRTRTGSPPSDSAETSAESPTTTSPPTTLPATAGSSCRNARLLDSAVPPALIVSRVKANDRHPD